MSRQRIFLLLVLLPSALGIATFAVLKQASSQDDGGVIHAPIAPHTPPAVGEAAPASGEIPPPANGASDAEASTSPRSTQPAAPPANSEHPETAVPAQNDSAEIYGPARFADSTETADDEVDTPVGYGAIRVAALPVGVGSPHNMTGARFGGGGGGGSQATSGSSSDAHSDEESSASPDDSTPIEPAPDDGIDAPDDVDSPPAGGDVPGAGSPPLLTPPDPDLYNPISPGPSDDGSPQPPTHVNVPEPATMGLLGLGLLGCAFFRRRR